MKRKNGDGTCYYINSKKLYAYQVQIAGHRKVFYGKTEREAYNKMMTYDGRENMSLANWLIHWFETYKKNDYKIGTYEKEFRRVNTIINLFEYSNYNMKEIKSIMIQEFINKLSETKKAKTIKNYMLLLNGAFKQAVIDGLIETNPCKSVSIPKSSAPSMIALNRADKDLFLAINQQNPYYEIFVFALNTGMRISEICGLQISDVDFTNNLIAVNQQLVRLKGKVILDSPKTENSTRKIPINKITKEILEKNINGSKDNFVFHNPKTNNILYQNTLSINAHRCFLKCYEITKKEVYLKANFHTFRHTFATQWILQGGNVNLLSKVLGHTDTSFTMRVYCQPDYSDIKNAMLTMSF